MAQYFQISIDQLKQLFPDLTTTVGEDNVQYTIVNHGQELHCNNLQLSNLQVQDEVRQGAVSNNCISVVKAENLNGQYCLSLKDVNPDPNNVYVLESLGNPSNSSSAIHQSEASQPSHQQVISTNSISSKQLQAIYIATASSEPVVPAVTYLNVHPDEVSELSDTTGVVRDSPQKPGCASLTSEEVVHIPSVAKLLAVNKENQVSPGIKGREELEEVSHGAVLSSSQVRVIHNNINRMTSQAEPKRPTQVITVTVPQQTGTVQPSSPVRQIQSNCQLSTTQVSLPNGQKISLQEYRQMHPQSQSPIIQTGKGLGQGEGQAQVCRGTPRSGKRTPRRGGATPRSLKRPTPMNNVTPSRVIVVDQRRDLVEQNLVLVRNDGLQVSTSQEQESAQMIGRQTPNTDLHLNHYGHVDEARQVVMLVPGGTIGEHQMLTVTVPTNDGKSSATIMSASDNSPRQVSRITPKSRLVSSSPGSVVVSPQRAVSNEGPIEQSSSGSYVGTPVLMKHNIEERKLVPGKVAHCQYCGYHSEDFNRCDRCRRKVPVNCKEMPITHSKIIKDGISSQKFYKTIREGGMSDNSVAKAERSTRSKKPRKFEEPVILTISSDEDEETEGKNDSNSTEASTRKYENVGMMSYGSIDHMLPPLSTLSAFEKEPVIKNSSCNEPVPEEEQNVAEAIEEGLQESQNGVPEDNCKDKERAVFLTCRTVRIGSYKAIPKDRVVICKEGVRIRVPDIEDSSKVVSITFMLKDVVKALIHFGRAMPVIFLYTSYPCGVKIRKALRMSCRNGLYYDPCASDETQKRITLLPERMTEETKNRLKSIFGGKDLLGELDTKEANDILVRASPKEVQETIKKSLASSPTMSSLRPVKDYAQKILIYPPPPAKGGITINPEDYMCLGEEQFLNDVIIDFYLKYLTQSCLSEEDQCRTHVFSSFFYKRLTTRPVRLARRHHPMEFDSSTSPAEKRHARVKSWTKNVDIFEKDFIIIPINESAHWFLAIICFPGLEGCVRMSDGAPVKLPPSKPKPSKKSKETKKSEMEKEELVHQACIVKPIQIGNTTITPITSSALASTPGGSGMVLPMATINLEEREGGMGGDDFSDRDEAEGEEEDIQMPSESEEEDGQPEGGSEEGKEEGEGRVKDGKGPLKEDGEEEEDGGEEESEGSGGDGGKGEEEGGVQVKKDEQSSKVGKTEDEQVSQKDDSKAAGDKASDKSDTEYCSHNENIKQPCILIFDSLAGSSRSRVVATLRDYLRIEYKVKKGSEREFSKDTIKGACPRVPQQTNFVDCGLYVLQYVESFFENPVKDYRIPIRSLTQWFPEDVVNRKREAIHELIIKLMNEQNITIELPRISFPSSASRTSFSHGAHDEEEEGVRGMTGDIGEMFKSAQEQRKLIVNTDHRGNRVVASGVRVVSMCKLGDKMVVLEATSDGESIRTGPLLCENKENRVAGETGHQGRPSEGVGGGGSREGAEERGEGESGLVTCKEMEGLEEGELEEGADEEEKQMEKELCRRQTNQIVRAYQSLATKRKSLRQNELLLDSQKNKEKCEVDIAIKRLKP